MCLVILNNTATCFSYNGQAFFLKMTVLVYSFSWSLLSDLYLFSLPALRSSGQCAVFLTYPGQTSPPVRRGCRIITLTRLTLCLA